MKDLVLFPRADLDAGRRRQLVVTEELVEHAEQQRVDGGLVEGGYLSNPEEARLINDAGYRRRLAEAVVRGLDTRAQVRTPDDTGHASGLKREKPEPTIEEARAKERQPISQDSEVGASRGRP